MDDELAIPEHLFTAPADPLTLQLTFAVTAASRVIGPKGGTLKTKGPDGTRYALKIPEGALILGTLVTMTPVTDVRGLPDGADPSTRIGVELLPDGLALERIATLTIRQPEPIPEDGAVVLSTSAAGQEAGRQHHTRTSKGAVTIPVDHFSSYELVWPMLISQARAIDRRLRQDAEGRLAASVASQLAMARQLQLNGIESAWTPEAIAQALVEQWKRDVLLPRLRAASNGCLEAMEAVTALVESSRQLAIIGIDTTTPMLDLIGDTGVVPADLANLLIQSCFKEAYDYCVRMGDFPELVAYYYSVFSRMDAFMGVQPTAEQVQLAHRYLERCGRWRLYLASSLLDRLGDDAIAGRSETQLEASALIHLQWERGDAGWGLLHSRIKGTAPVEVTHLTTERPSCPVRIRHIENPVPAEAEVTSMTMEHYDIPIINRTLPVGLKELSIDVTFGMVTWLRYDCLPGPASSVDTFIQQAYLVDPIIKVPEDLEAFQGKGAAHVAITTGWQFHVQPIKAVLVLQERIRRWELDVGGQTQTIPVGRHDRLVPRLEVVFTHDPR